MKNIPFILILLISALLLPACASQNEWTTHSVSDFVENEQFYPYSFQYPSGWILKEGNNHFALFSKKRLLTDVPDKLQPGQIIVTLSMNTSMSPEKMVDFRADWLDEIIGFDDTISIQLNGRPAAYKEGTHFETKDESFFIAVDMGKNMRGLLNSRMAEGELEKWRETLMRIAESLQIDA
ncbi:MAG: hypothetical protein HY865_04655 [Chloroflexi bacterium]|nr:hypothetical protein [Chloroflexota bacterium]